MTTWTRKSIPLFPGSIWDGGASSWDGGATPYDNDGAIWDAANPWTGAAVPAATWTPQTVT